MGQFVHDMVSVDLTVGAAVLGLSAADYTAALARQAQFQNQITVSQFYANESRLPGVGGAANVLLAPTTTSPGFLAAQAIMATVTSSPASVTAADAAIALSATTGSLTPITNAPPPPAPGQTFTLTTAVGVAIPGLIGSNGTTDTSGNDIINAIYTGVPASTTLQSFDTLNGGLGTNTMNIIATNGAGGFDTNVTMPGVTVANVQVLNVSDAGGPVNVDTSTGNFAGILSVNETVGAGFTGMIKTSGNATSASVTGLGAPLGIETPPYR